MRVLAEITYTLFTYDSDTHTNSDSQVVDTFDTLEDARVYKKEHPLNWLSYNIKENMTILEVLK